jgi:hypothetical protein
MATTGRPETAPDLTPAASASRLQRTPTRQTSPEPGPVGAADLAGRQSWGPKSRERWDA